MPPEKTAKTEDPAAPFSKITSPVLACRILVSRRKSLNCSGDNGESKSMAFGIRASHASTVCCTGRDSNLAANKGSSTEAKSRLPLIYSIASNP